jgi:hypothetical protein
MNQWGNSHGLMAACASLKDESFRKRIELGDCRFYTASTLEVGFVDLGSERKAGFAALLAECAKELPRKQG